jgi:hypothetical protein
MFDFKDDKQKTNEKEKLRIGALSFVGIGIILTLIGIALIIPAFAFNQTAIDEAQLEFVDTLAFEGSFPFFYIAFMIVIMAGFMVAMLVYREDRESIFFSLSSLVIALVLTLMFTSPLTFDMQEHETKTMINFDLTSVTSGTLETTITQIPIIPYDESLRMSLSLVFTGLTIFLGLYSMYIITNYHEGKKLNPNRG